MRCDERGKAQDIRPTVSPGAERLSVSLGDPRSNSLNVEGSLEPLKPYLNNYFGLPNFRIKQNGYILTIQQYIKIKSDNP